MIVSDVHEPSRHCNLFYVNSLRIHKFIIPRKWQQSGSRAQRYVPLFITIRPNKT